MTKGSNAGQRFRCRYLEPCQSILQLLAQRRLHLPVDAVEAARLVHARQNVLAILDLANLRVGRVNVGERLVERGSIRLENAAQPRTIGRRELDKQPLARGERRGDGGCNAEISLRESERAALF